MTRTRTANSVLKSTYQLKVCQNERESTEMSEKCRSAAALRRGAQHVGDLRRHDVVAAPGLAERRVERRLAQRVDDVRFRAVREQILDHARPAELHRAVQRRLAV